MKRMFYEELKKVIINSKLWIALILALFFLSIVNIKPNANNNLNFNLVEEDKLYNSSINFVSGKYDEAVETKINEELDIISKEYYNIKSRFENHLEVEDHELKRLGVMEVEMNVLKYLIDQIEYVKGNPYNREIINLAEWNPLIMEYYPNYFMIGIVILLSAYTYHIENESSMDLLINTSYRGNRSIVGTKYLVIVLMILILVIVPEIVKLAVNFPSNWSAGIQSHPSYMLSGLNLTLGQTYLLIILIKLLGLTLISTFTIALIQKTRNVILGMLLPTVFFILPYLLFKMPLQRLWIPTNLTSPFWLLNYTVDTPNSIFPTLGYKNLSFILTSLFFTIFLIIVSVHKKKIFHVNS